MFRELEPENQPDPSLEAPESTEDESVLDEDEGGEYVIPPGAVTGKKDIDPESESEPEEDGAQEEEGTPSPEKPEEDLEDKDLEAILELGKKVYDYQKDHPGYDPILTHKEFTRRSMELAELKRTLNQTPPAPAPEEKPKTPVQDSDLDLSKFDPKEVETFQKLAKSLGFVHKADLEAKEQETRQMTYQQTRQAELNAFIQDHPEYKPENDEGDVKWKALIDEFSLYKLPEDPKKIRSLLEKAHSSVYGGASTDTKRLREIIAKKQQANSGQGANAASPSPNVPKPSSTKKQSLKNTALKGGLKGFSEDELNELFGD